MLERAFLCPIKTPYERDNLLFESKESQQPPKVTHSYVIDAIGLLVVSLFLKIKAVQNKIIQDTDSIKALQQIMHKYNCRIVD